MPSIENLRKQAKRVVRWHREGHFPVAALIRAHLAEFGDWSDEEILSHPLQLTHAQELIARQGGFSSWQALLQEAEKMPESITQTQVPITFNRAEPQLLVTDLVRSLSHFTEKLGFEIEFSYGEPPFYAQVARGEAHLNLRLTPRLLVEPSTASKEDFLAATICVTSIKELFLEYQSSGADIHQNLRTEPWGSRTFIVADPDGNLILFAE